MGIPLGDGDFIITANSSDFDRARADIFGVMRRIDQRADQSADLIDRRFTEAANEITRQFDVAGVNMERSITRATENISDEVRQMGNDIERSVSNATAGLAEQFDRELAQLRAASERTSEAVGNDADSMGDAIAREIARGVAVANAALALLGDGSDRALGRITGLIGGLGKLTLTIGALSSALAGMIQLVAAAAASLEQLAGIALLAPTAIIGLVGIIGTLKVALNGVGDAIGAGVAGDWEKFAEAMRKLSPAAHDAVAGLVPVFERMRDLKTLVQDRFFVELGNQLASFGQTAIGVAERVMPKLASSLGEVSEAFLRTAQTSSFLEGIEAILKRTAAGVSRLADPISHLTSAFGDLFLAGAGYVDGFYDSLGRLIDRFATWIRVSSDNGNLKRWIDGAIDGFQQIGRIIKDVGGIFGALNSVSSSAGAGILSILENITSRLNEAFRSDVGQSFLISSFSLLAEIMRTLNIVMGPVVALLARVATIVNDQLARAVAYVNPYLETFAGWVGDLGKTVTQAGPDITAFAGGAIGYLADRLRVLLDALAPIGDAVAGTGEAVKASFSGIGTDTLDSLITAVGNLGVALAGVGSNVLVSLSHIFAELVRLSPRVVTFFERVATILGNALAESLDALTPLLDPVLTFFEKLLPVLDLIGTAFVAVVRGASDLVVALAPLANAIADVAGRLSDDLNPAIKEMSDGFSRNVTPAVERVSQSLGDKLVAGFERVRPALNSLIEGFRSVAEPAGRLIESVGRLLAAFGPLISILGEVGAVLYEKLIPPTFALLGAFLEVLTFISDSLEPVVRGFSEFLGGAFTLVLENIGPAFTVMSEEASTALHNFEDAFRPIFEALEEFLSVAIPIAVETTRIIFGNAFDAIVTTVTVAWSLISGIADAMILFFSEDFAEAFRRLGQTISEIWNAIASYIVDTINRIVSFLDVTGVSDVARAVGRVFQAGYDAVVGWLDAMYKAVVGWVGNAVNAFFSLSGLIGRAFVSSVDWLYYAGRDIVQGLINGLIDKAKDLGNIVKDWIVNPIKGALGGIPGFRFGSPSKVTTQYGEWISQGLAIGMKDAEASVVAAAESLTLAASLPGMSPASPNMGVTGPSPFVPDVSPSASSGGGIVFGPGSIQVVFQGVVPSESEAFATGEAVGAGIADVIARRDARVSVGVL